MPPEVKKRRFRKKRWRRLEEGEVHIGAYIVPNLFTTGNLMSGFFGIVSAINGNYQLAALAIFVSCVFDILDGQVARLTRATSRFGVEYDSLADLVAFGVAPSILMYLWALKPFGRMGWLAAFVFVACGALRLARFNVQVETSSKKYFVGLPIPGAANMIATTVFFIEGWRVDFTPYGAPSLLVVTYLLGFLMVSTVPFYSFKDFEMIKAKPIPVLCGVLVLMSVIAIEPQLMLFSMCLTYVLAGPVLFVVQRVRRKPAEQLPPGAGEKTQEIEIPGDREETLS
ncbi:MAG: CDP-diacylglycerol--serine O-phosphatidyltransferase [Syntrophobacteraceae bacterium]|jgi:CDP-diacylglycerol--serine O-phosphatidyltransferase|nr:CDP-diacylglycerol--serine O-phosphatidyltransferase [Syntrophobacteraceae bacterium]